MNLFAPSFSLEISGRPKLLCQYDGDGNICSHKTRIEFVKNVIESFRKNQTTIL